MTDMIIQALLPALMTAILGGITSAVVNALEFTLSSGNIASGTFKLYGVP